MNVLGIDAGFTALGVAVVKVDEKSPTLPLGSLVYRNCVRTDRSKDRDSVTTDDAKRITQLVDEYLKIVETYRPDVAVAELPTGGARGAGAIKGMAFSTSMTVTALHLLKVKMIIISPLANKKASTGNPNAEKSQVMSAVGKFWPGIVWPRLPKGKIDMVYAEAVCDALSTIVWWSKSFKTGRSW